MDEWTKTSMEAQELLFRRIDAEGNYMPHQAIYGFASYRVLQYCEISLLLSLLDKLVNTGRSKGELQCPFSFIEIGCAEGFYPRLLNVRYGAETYGVDLSASGIRRMWEYHKIEGICADAQALPIQDNAFDVVLCSNTVEHITYPVQAINELLRITKKHLFIGVPQALTQKDIDNFKPDFNAERDQHVHIFTKSTFQQLLPSDYSVTFHHASSFPVLVLNALYKRTLGRFSHCLPLVKSLLYLDRISSRLMPRRSIHLLTQIDLTEGERSPAGTHALRTSLARGEGEGSRLETTATHESPPIVHNHIPDFILKKIYELNRDTLEQTVLHLGTENSQQWREFTVKLAEDVPSEKQDISEKLLAFLACPHCKSAIARFEQTLICQSCGAKYPIKDGIPIMYRPKGDGELQF